MNEQLSLIDYIKKRYKIENIEDYSTFIIIAIMVTILIYLSLQFPVFQTFIVVFVIILFASYFINQYYKMKYEKQIELINEKFKKMKNQIEEILKSTKTD